MRADGTVRRARKIRPGYVPQEDVPKYVPRAKRQGNEGAILKGKSDDLADSLAKLSLNQVAERERDSEKSEKQEGPDSERGPRRKIIDPAQGPNQARSRPEAEKKPRRMIVDPEKEPTGPKAGQSLEATGPKMSETPERRPRRMLIDPSQEPKTIQRSGQRISQSRTQTTNSESERRLRRMRIDPEQEGSSQSPSKPTERKPTPEGSGKYVPPWKRGS